MKDELAAPHRRSQHPSCRARRLARPGKAHTKEGDAIAAARRRLPMVKVSASTPLIGEHRPVTLLDVFEGRRQLILHLGHIKHARALIYSCARHHIRRILPGAI
jgi:predicted dithiol-disulfide oxidoreductase (DUF899 family)